MRFGLQHDVVAAVQPLSYEHSEFELGPLLTVAVRWRALKSDPELSPSEQEFGNVVVLPVQQWMG